MSDIKAMLGIEGDLGIKVIRARPTLRSRIGDAWWQLRNRLRRGR